MRKRKTWRQRCKEERGATLVVAVLVLVALTIIGLTAVTSSTLSVDISGNLSAKNSAFHAAEACVYYQIRRLQSSGPSTSSWSYDLGNGLSCSVSAPSSTGGIAGGGTLDGYSLEAGSSSVGFANYQFTVTGNGPRSTQSSMSVGVGLPVAGGGY